MKRSKKEVTLHNVMFPIWFLLVFPIAWIVVLPANFIIDSIVLLISVKLLKLANIKGIYKHTILKVWLIGFASDFVGAGILFLSTNGTGSWYEYLNSVSWNPFDNWYALLFVAFAVLVSGILIYIGNLKYSFKNIDVNLQNKRKLALALAVFTAPYIFFYPSSLINGGSWDELDFMTNHIVRRAEFRLEVTLNQDSADEKIYIMSYIENEIKDAINNAEKTSDELAENFDQPKYILTFYGREYASRTAIPLYIDGKQGYFEYKDQWYELDQGKTEPFLEAMQTAQNSQGKREFTIIPDPNSSQFHNAELEEPDKDGKDQYEYPVFEDSGNKYYCQDKQLYDTAVIRFEGQEEIELYKALELGLVSPQELIDHGLKLIVEPKNN